MFQASRDKRKVIFKRAESYIKKYRKEQRDKIRLKRQARDHGNFYVEGEPKLAFVIRIRGFVQPTSLTFHSFHFIFSSVSTKFIPA